MKHPLTQALLCRLAAYFIRLVYYTNRVEVVEGQNTKPYRSGAHNAIIAFWHGRLMMMPFLCPPQRTMYVMISHHTDGELIARTMGHFGFKTVRGSSRKGARAAILGAVEALREGANISITPDGPRGPARQAAPGATHIARKCRVPIIPISIGASRRKHFSSWDRFMIALPFGRLVFVVGDPLWIEPEATNSELEEKQQELAHTLNRITDEADVLTGHAMIAA